MCLCVPLRLGVLFAAAFTCLTSAFYCCDRAHWNDVFRHLQGGYQKSSQIAVGAIEVTGVPFGAVGTLGAWYAKDDYIGAFNAWQMVRVLVWAFMYCVDAPLMRHCEGWVNNVKEMTEQHGWNALMYQIAVGGNCPGERVRFFVLSFLTLIVCMYMVSATTRYHNFMSSVPKHLLRIPKETGGMFYAQSLAERAALGGAWGTHERPWSEGPAQGPAGEVFGGPAFGFAPPSFGSMPAVGGQPPGGMAHPAAGPTPLASMDGHTL